MSLRDELSATTHQGRVTTVLSLARQQAPSLEALDAGDAFDRRLSGVASFIDRDGARVLRQLADPSRTVRSLAMVLAPLVCDDAQAHRALELAWSLKGERRLLLGMARRRRQGVIDAFLDWLFVKGHHRDLIDALSFGSEACVARHLEVALERPSARFWQGLATRHPARFVDVLLARWKASPGEADPVTRQLTARFHPVVVHDAPQPALAWCRVLLERDIAPADEVWQRLLRRAPEATVALAIEFDAPLPLDAMWRRGRRLSVAVLTDLLRRAPQVFGGLGAWVDDLAPEARRALADAWVEVSAEHPRLGTHLLTHATPGDAREAAFVAWSRASRGPTGAISAAQVAALPLDLAEREARRHLHDVEALATNPLERFSGRARFLPWDELTEALRAYLGHPEGGLRALALRELLSIPGLRPDDVTLPSRALELVTARRFEQDPVRAAMFETLGRWPRRVWTKAHLPAVAQAVRDALDASDCSPQTAAAAEHLVVRLFHVDAPFAAGLLTTLIRERGTLHDANLGAKLSRAELAAAGPTLLELATTWEKTERWPWLQGLVVGLGDKVTAIEGLVEVVVRARQRVPWEASAVAFTRLLASVAPDVHARTLSATLTRFLTQGWYAGLAQLAQAHGEPLRRQPRRRVARKPALPEPFTESLTKAALELPRTHLPSVLAAMRTRAPSAFSALLPKLLRADESVVVFPVVHDFLHRHRQDLLGPFLGDRVISGRFATGATRWLLPFVDGFFRWSPAQSETFAAALERIVADEQRDTPTVFAALVRWPSMPWASMTRLLARAKDGRPFVQEKAIRVLSRCDAGQGVPTLIECLGDARARFAIYGLRRAVLRMVPPEATAVLSQAPLGKVTVAKEVVRLLGELRDEAAYQRVLDLASGGATTGGKPLHRDVRIAVLRALWDHLDRDPTWAVYERAVADPDWVLATRLGDVPANRLTRVTDARLSRLLATLVERPEPEARLAMLQRATWLAVVDRERAFLTACRARLGSRLDDEVQAAMSAMLSRCTEDDVPALEATLAALRTDRRTLEQAARTLLAARVTTRRSWSLMASALERVASGDARLAGLQVQAVAAREDVASWAAVLGTLAAADRLAGDVVRVAASTTSHFTAHALEPHLEALVSHGHAGVRRTGLAALERVVSEKGWSPARTALLRTLRVDPVPWLAEAAALVWPPREDDPGFG